VRERPDTLCNCVELAVNEVVPKSAGNSEENQESDRSRSNDDDSDDEQTLRIIYRHYATLYFVFCVDEAESELGILDLIQASRSSTTTSLIHCTSTDPSCHDHSTPRSLSNRSTAASRTSASWI
jgi:hypothetical protein